MDAQLLPLGASPSYDGQVALYLPAKPHVETQWFEGHRRAIFVNGVLNSGGDHRRSAEALSLCLMRPVIGVYNASGGAIVDLVQSLRDKWRFHGPGADSAGTIASGGRNTEASRLAIRGELFKNPCSASLFDVLLDPKWAATDVHAHSQGNLILCNALCALEALGRTDAIQHRHYYSYGSPAVAGNWPKGIARQEYGFSFDWVTMLTRLGSSWSASTLGLPRRGNMPWSHAFTLYMENLPDFIINKHRVGALGVTLSMDEGGLARDLLNQPMPTVEGVFERLHRSYRSDVDDVALAYVRARAQCNGPAAVQRIRSTAPRLHAMLTKAMREGWTSAAEKECLALLG